MKLIPVESSNIKAIGYERCIPTTRGFEYFSALCVHFCHGKIYGYIDFPEEKFEEFLKAESKGKYFNKEILGKYEEILLGEIPQQ